MENDGFIKKLKSGPDPEFFKLDNLIKHSLIIKRDAYQVNKKYLLLSLLNIQDSK